MDIDLPVQQEFLNRIMDYADSKNVEMILGIDTNSHSTMYGKDTNKRGKDMEEFIIDNGLSIENIGKIPTFETIRGNLKMATCIDVTLSRGLDDKIAKWTVDQTYNGSDHNTITFEIVRKNLKMEKTRNWDKGDWPAFKGRIYHENFNEPEIVTEKKLDNCVRQMYRKLNVVLNDTCPKKVRKIRLKANVWYTSKHKELAKKIKTAYKKGKRNLGEAWTFYKKLIKRYKKLCKRSRNASWKKYKENRQTVDEMVKRRRRKIRLIHLSKQMEKQQTPVKKL